MVKSSLTLKKIQDNNSLIKFWDKTSSHDSGNGLN